MLFYFLRRVALTVPTFLALMFLTFVAIRLVPGDPVEVRVGEHGMSPERLAFFRHELGLDQPVWKQFFDYVWKLVHGDFGVSLATQQKVLSEFFTLFPATLELSFFAMLFAVAVGVPAGAIAAVKRGSLFDQALMTVSLFGYSMPIFWWGLLLIMFVSVRLGASAGLWPHRSHQLLFRPADRLHDHRRADVRSAGRVHRRATPSRPARDRARHRAARRHRAHDPLLDARGPERGLRSHRPRQGSGAEPGHRRPCAAQCAPAGGDRDRPLRVRPDGGRGADRNDLLLARRRQMADRIRSAGATIRRCRAESCSSRPSSFPSI